MFEILRLSEHDLEVLEKPAQNCWINISNPNQEDLLKLKLLIKLPDELILSLKDIDEIPIIEQTKNYTFIIIRAPYKNPNVELEYSTAPVGIFITKDNVITISYHEHDAIEKLKTQRFPFRKTQLTFRLLLTSAKLYLEYLNIVKKRMYEVERELEKSQKNKIIMEFLEIEKDLVYFITSLESNQVLTQRIAKDGLLVKTNEDKKLIEKVIDENKQAIYMTNVYSNILSNTLDAFASIISNNLNIVMKFLTSVTIILALPTLVASVYGMNVNLPFQEHPHAFAITMLFAFGLSFIFVILFWKKKFF